MPDPLFPDRQFTCFSFFAILAKAPGPSRNHPETIFIFSQNLSGVILTIIPAILQAIEFCNHSSFPDIQAKSRKQRLKIDE